jgi:hypothetical protein
MIMAGNVTPVPPLPSGTTRMLSASAIATRVAATAHHPAQSKPVSAPAVSRPTMSPAANDAAPAPSCCTAPLKLKKLPRRRGATLPVMSAIAGPKRPGTKTKNRTLTATAAASGSGGRCVITTMGTRETNARIVNTRFLPKRSASQPMRGA